eukprot:scaffold81337_cov25-Phaeocystis_antarctica.AAC.1
MTRDEGSRRRRALGRDQEAARSNRRDALNSGSVTSQWRAQEGAGQPARTALHHGLLIANTVEGHHEGALHAGRDDRQSGGAAGKPCWALFYEHGGK